MLPVSKSSLLVQTHVVRIGVWIWRIVDLVTRKWCAVAGGAIYRWPILICVLQVDDSRVYEMETVDIGHIYIGSIVEIAPVAWCL